MTPFALMVACDSLVSSPSVLFQRTSTRTTIRWKGMYWVIDHINLFCILQTDSFECPLIFDPFLWLWATEAGVPRVIWSQQLFKEPEGTRELFIWLLQDRGTRAPFIGEKQWKLCAKELITRCICVLFWRGGEGCNRTGPQGNEGGWI